MRIVDIIRSERPSLSFEVSPPSTLIRYDAIKEITEQVAALNPDFMSVTYGAGGGTNDFTVPIAANLQDHWNVPTCRYDETGAGSPGIWSGADCIRKLRIPCCDRSNGFYFDQQICRGSAR